MNLEAATYPHGCSQFHNGEEECALNAEDRKVVDEIHARVEDIARAVDRDEKVTRALSSTLIGKANGETFDDGGGRIGRLERLVGWAITGVVGIIIWLLAQFVTKMMK